MDIGRGILYIGVCRGVGGAGRGIVLGEIFNVYDGLMGVVNYYGICIFM